MIQSFLRLFGSYRELELRLRDAEALRVKSDDEMRHYRHQAEEQREMALQARAEANYSLKAFANWQAALANAPQPFPDVVIVSPPPQIAAEDFIGGRGSNRSARQVQQEAIARSRHEAFMARGKANGAAETE